MKTEIDIETIKPVTFAGFCRLHRIDPICRFTAGGIYEIPEGAIPPEHQQTLYELVDVAVAARTADGWWVTNRRESA